MAPVIFIFEDQKYWITNGIKAKSIKCFKGILEEEHTTVWIPPTSADRKEDIIERKGIENDFNRKVLESMKSTFSFDLSESMLIPFDKYILVFGSESSGIDIDVSKYLVDKAGAIPIYIPQNRTENGRTKKKINASFNLSHAILLSLITLRSKPIPSFISESGISLWFPVWSPSSDRKDNQITTRMIGAMYRDLEICYGIKNLYWDHQQNPVSVGRQVSIANTVFQGLLNKDSLFTKTPDWENPEILLVDIVTSYEGEWEKYPIICIPRCKKILISISDFESKGLYQRPRSIRLNYGGPDSTALVWFLGLTF